MRVPLGEITSVHAHQRWMTAEVDEARHRLGKSLIERIEVRGGVASVHPASLSWYPSQNPNRVDRVRRGLGAEELVELYDRNGVPRFFVYADPLPGWEQLHQDLDRHGFRQTIELVWLGATLNRSFTLPPTLPAPGRIVLATKETRDDLMAVLTFGGAQTPAFEDATLGLFERPGAFTLLAYDGDRPVATGCLYLHEGVAYLANGLTIPEARGRGYQTHLIRRRIEIAQDIGARIAVSATYRFLERSFANLMRAGLVESWVSRIYRYESDPQIRAQLQHTDWGHPEP